MTSFTFCVPGQPLAKARPRFARGFKVKTYTPNTTKAYEKLLAYAAKREIKEPFEGQISIKMCGQFKIPASWSEKQKQAAIRGERFPTRPDLDNVIKILMDGLNGVAYEDDGQVVKVEAIKRYGVDPCLVVTVEQL